MRAVLSKAPGGPETLVVEEVSDPTPKAGEVVIEVRAVGINFPDTLIIEDKYQFRPQRPFAPGAEVAGVVEAIGEGVKGIHKGDRVIAVPGWGGLVERIAVPAASVIPIPKAMDFETAAALIMTYGTSYYALKDRAKLQAGETLLVLGAAGGVGAAAVELGKAMGARVVAAASTNDKVEFALELGADNGLIYPSGPMDKAAQKELSGELKLATGRDGADVVYDAVGGDYAEPALRAMDWCGRYLVVGFPAGIPSLPLNLTLLKSVAVIGVFWGAAVMRDPKGHAANMADLMTLWSEGKIRPRVSRTFPLHKAHEAIQALGDRSAMGKIVVTVGP
ncbi:MULTISPECIES: NADPH:quinone oxidoreductase family protein [unclassified Brevundimonas]|jgi:NADPH2:quinone reductase|uniref:NADPH:quinone oxidoreductase family protein n=1 Tax=unclassified Brevundimonas TaxID=2622653 RepID=UPI000C652375|nr:MULTISPECIES: NADPH:quinone oxidoreductase family protein [unclassified Brevundimonas]MAL89626.1 NADPH:quinone oxidoreductase [Brevundimonas sp.]HAJ03961.1 NADPH:quinone oxidoreductase [Brevundimonas sp.]|tara:strand:- start:57523 stop:58524 length:1002 start_codon:yes stop_codon:yes gene_type:complete